MARPIKEGLDYFAHDVDLSDDDKIETLEAVFGNDGYASYLKLLERIYRNGGKLFISDAETMQKYSRRCNIADVSAFEKMIDFMAKIDLFDKKLWTKAKCLTSKGILKRMQVVVEKRLRMKERYNKKVSDAETHPETQQSKVKKSKVKKRIAPGKPPISSDEVENLRKGLKWDDQKIKTHFLNREYSEVEIDAAMGKKF